MKLYNTLSHKVETFKPRDSKCVKVYTCGPTVYSFAHVGNFTAYVYWDLLVRTLQANGWKVKRVLNITDDYKQFKIFYFYDNKTNETW